MNGNGNEGQKEEAQVAQSALPIGGNGERDELARHGVHLVCGANENKSRDQHVHRRIARDENEDTVRVGRQPDVILTCTM